MGGDAVLRSYVYRGDRLTDPALRGAACIAVLRPDGKCIRGRGNMLVRFAGEDAPRVVLARQLRKATPREEAEPWVNRTWGQCGASSDA